MPAMKPQSIASGDFNIQLIFKALTLAFRSNIGFAKWRVQCFYETFVQSSTAVILLNFCAKNPPHRQAETSYRL
jgi:hypothetical protein